MKNISLIDFGAGNLHSVYKALKFIGADVEITNDINKIPLPLALESELKITSSADDQTYQKYLSDLQITIGRYFSEEDITNIGAILKSASDSDVADIKKRADSLAEELKTILVPQKLVTYHQYIIAFFQLIPKVLIDKSDPGLNGDVWYQNTQALLAVSQKLSLLSQVLSQRMNLQE